MNIKRLLIAVILIIILFGAISFYFIKTNHYEVLVLGSDTTEKRPGIGGIDMAFMVELGGNKILKMKAIYPGGMTHPKKKAPKYLINQGASSKLYLHDSFWDADLDQDAQLAKEIVQTNTKFNPDYIVVFTPLSIDAFLNAAGTYNGTSCLELLREDQNGRGISREGAVKNIMDSLMEAAFSPRIFNLIVSFVSSYYTGNIYIFNV